MFDEAVVNASPLITLAAIGELGLLRAVAARVWVPEPVAREVRWFDPSARTELFRATDWLRVVVPTPVPSMIDEWGLDAGEKAVLAHAKMHGVLAILDDLPGRNCAKAAGIDCMGTLGVVRAAKRRGLIPAVAPVYEALREAGLYVSDSLINDLLRLEGE